MVHNHFNNMQKPKLNHQTFLLMLIMPTCFFFCKVGKERVDKIPNIQNNKFYYGKHHDSIFFY